jgi:argininosuccinate lyase
MDAVATRDFLVESAAALAGLAATLSGIAADGIHFSNRGYLALDDDYASTSSIMPQKVNPDTLELVRATAGDAVAGLNGLLTTVKGLPRAYNRDLQRATPHMWSAVEAVVEATDVTAGAMATATWNEATLEAAAAEGFAAATGVADRLAMAGIPFRTAHEIVATAAEDGGDLAAIEAAIETIMDESLDAVADAEAIEAILDPADNVAMRDSHGGPAPAVVEPAIARARETVGDHRNRLEARRADLADASDRLEREVASYR